MFLHWNRKTLFHQASRSTALGVPGLFRGLGVEGALEAFGVEGAFEAFGVEGASGAGQLIHKFRTILQTQKKNHQIWSPGRRTGAYTKNSVYGFVWRITFFFFSCPFVSKRV